MNNINDTNNFVISLTNSSSNSTINTGVSSHQGSVENIFNANQNEQCISVIDPSLTTLANATGATINPSTIQNPSYVNNLQTVNLSKSNDVDFASLLMNINPNDYMLPTLNFSNTIGANANGQLGGGGVNSAYNNTASNNSACLGNWEWSAFNSGMVSAASVDCSGPSLNSVSSDPVVSNNSKYNNGGNLQMRNLSNFISNIGSTNSKGHPNVNSTIARPAVFVQNSCTSTIGSNNFVNLSSSQPITDIHGNQTAAYPPQNNAQINGQCSNLAQFDSLVRSFSGNVSKIANYETDAQRAFNCLPQAINFLNKAPVNEASRAAYLVYLLSKKEACRYVLCGNSNLSVALVNAIVRLQNHQSVVRYCTAIIYHLMISDVFVKHYIATPGAIKVICELTVSSVEATAFYAVATVHTLLVKFPDLRNQVLETNCFEKIVPLLMVKNPKFVTLVADVLHFLSIGNAHILMSALNTDLHSQLVHLLRTSKFEKLLFTVCRFVKSLSSNNVTKMALLQQNIMPVLTDLLLNKSRRIACTSLWALRNFSDSCSNDLNLKELLIICTRFIHVQISDISASSKETNPGTTADNNIVDDRNKSVGSRQTKYISEPSLVACAVGILANLTCNNQENKETLVRSGGLEALVTLCLNAYTSKEIIEPTMYVLRNITSQHKFVDHAIATLKLLNCFKFLSNCLNLLFNDSADDFFPQLKKATMSVISNVIINNESSLDDFFSLQVAQKTTNILRYSIEMIKQFYALANDSAVNDSDKELSKQILLYNKLIEDSIILMFIFVGSCSGRNSYEIINTIVTSEFLDTLTQLLFSEDGGVLSCVIGILSAVSRAPNGMTLIYNKYFTADSTASPLLTNNDSVGKLLMNQLACIANSSNFDNSIKSAATSLINNLTNYLNSNLSATIFSPSHPTTNNAMHNLNNLGLNLSASQNSPYNQSLGSTPVQHSSQSSKPPTQFLYDSNLSRQNFYNNSDNRANDLSSFSNQQFPRKN